MASEKYHALTGKLQSKLRRISFDDQLDYLTKRYARFKKSNLITDDTKRVIDDHYWACDFVSQKTYTERELQTDDLVAMFTGGENE